MGKIDLSINKVGLAHNIQKAKENNVIIPTIAQMQNPDLIPEKIKAKLSHTGGGFETASQITAPQAAV